MFNKNNLNAKPVESKVMPKVEVVRAAPQSAQPRYDKEKSERQEKFEKDKKEKEDRHKAMLEDIKKKAQDDLRGRNVVTPPQIMQKQPSAEAAKRPATDLQSKDEPSTPRNVFED